MMMMMIDLSAGISSERRKMDILINNQKVEN